MHIALPGVGHGLDEERRISSIHTTATHECTEISAGNSFTQGYIYKPIILSLLETPSNQVPHPRLRPPRNDLRTPINIHRHDV